MCWGGIWVEVCLVLGWDMGRGVSCVGGGIWVEVCLVLGVGHG